jgi:hypothetical protein
MTKWMLGVVAAAALVVPAGAQDAVAVVKKAIDAHGGAENITKYKASSGTMKGTLSISGQDMEFTGTVLSETPSKHKVKIEADIMGQKLTVLQICNGEKAKSTVSIGGMAIPGGGDEEKDELKLATAIQDAMTLVPLLDDKNYTLKLEDKAKVNDVDCDVVKVTLKKFSKDITLYFDAKTNLLIKTQRKGKGPSADGTLMEVNEETYASKYEKIQGLIQQPTKIEVKHDGKKFMSYTMSDIKILEEIDAKEFGLDD